MIRKASPTLIGAFVIGAILIILAGVILLGGHSFFQDKTTCVTYFEEGIAGLDIGARVELGGVRVGTVTDIKIVFDENNKEVRRPVAFQLEHSRFTLLGGGQDKTASLLDAINRHGLRTQIATDNLLTGKLKINMVFVSPMPPAPTLAGDVAQAVEVPSVRSPFSNLVRTAEDLPLTDMINDLHQAVKAGQRALLSSSEVISNLNGLVHNLDSKIDPLLTNLTQLTENAERLIQPESDLNREARAALEEVQAAARSVREFSDFATRHPESLLKGKP